MLFVILLILVLSSSFILLFAKNNKVQKLKRDYDQALKGDDQKKALKAGRRYYMALRGYKRLTALDELELDKEIATMGKR